MFCESVFVHVEVRHISVGCLGSAQESMFFRSRLHFVVFALCLVSVCLLIVYHNVVIDYS